MIPLSLLLTRIGMLLAMVDLRYSSVAVVSQMILGVDARFIPQKRFHFSSSDISLPLASHLTLPLLAHLP